MPSDSAARVWVLGDDGAILNLATEHGSLGRVPPPQFDVESKPAVADGLRWIVAGGERGHPPRLELVSFAASGRELDRLERIATAEVPCPAPTTENSACFGTKRLNLVGGLLDRLHPQGRDRAIRAEVGGWIAVLLDDTELAVLRVGGPRRSAIGPAGRLMARLRVFLLRDGAHGAPPLGATDREARDLVLGEVRKANEIWGQCGIQFGNAEDVPMEIVPPPGVERVTFGCGLGLPAAGGGQLAMTVAGAPIRFETTAARSPLATAEAFGAHVSAQLGYAFEIEAVSPGSVAARPLADLTIRLPNGQAAPLAPLDDEALSTDGALSLCLGVVDLSDGLSHFTDHSAERGTEEERALIAAFDDQDPTTIEVLVVSSFKESPRLGESFIRADGSSLQSTVIVGAAGIASGASSNVLAHELGHVLLNMIGHPDDFGVDRALALMDADASGRSVYGPVRLSRHECQRAFRESGPGAATELLRPWPFSSHPLMRGGEHERAGAGPATDKATSPR